MQAANHAHPGLQLRARGRLYDIPVSRWLVLTHAEILPTYGIMQRWKWDIIWLSGMPAPNDPIAGGDRLPAMVRAELETL